VQIVPPVEQLLATMPSGREYHNPKPYRPPSLDSDVLERMRAPPDSPDPGFGGTEADSGSEEEERSDPVGAFPGTQHDYQRDLYY
jgi:hypothetical protein